MAHTKIAHVEKAHTKLAHNYYNGTILFMTKMVDFSITFDITSSHCNLLRLRFVGVIEGKVVDLLWPTVVTCD